MIQYDRKVIQEFAQRLYRQAKTIIFTCTIFGLLVGAGLGFSVANAVRQSEPIIIVSLCAILGGAIGGWVGVQRSFALRLRAQEALCQMMIELNTSRSDQSSSREAFAAMR